MNVHPTKLRSETNKQHQFVTIYLYYYTILKYFITILILLIFSIFAEILIYIISMKNIFIFLTILTFVSCQNKSNELESTPGRAITINEVQTNKLVEFYLADIYTDTTNFVKFIPSSLINENGITEFYYKCSDKRYKDWLVTYNPRKETKFQWLIKNPQDMKGPVGGGIYCITTKCSCSTWGTVIVSCYSNCTEETCCQSWLNFKKC